MKDVEGPLRQRTPRVFEPREFLEIVRDFTHPRDVVREAISNALDWRAKCVDVTVFQDKSRADEELVIQIHDDGVGLSEDRLTSFFDLGRSTRDDSQGSDWKVGYKGHGTKTYFNCRQVEVHSQSAHCSVYAIMDQPLQQLLEDRLPPYEFALQGIANERTFTDITIRGYNMNQEVRDFAHRLLRDHIRWFTRFGSVEEHFGHSGNSDAVVRLQGLGASKPESIGFGHVFPKLNDRVQQLQKTRPGDWTNVFVKRWEFANHTVIDHPGKTIDLLFYIEGDQAKRSYNDMLRGPGKTPEYGMYKVEDRYGLWACKDYIPVVRRNDWLGLGKRLETKYHAFVNSQDFRLTANRGDIGNTPPTLLDAIQRTVQQLFEEEIIGSSDYEEYLQAAELEQQYQTAAQERKDFDMRRKRAQKKRVAILDATTLVEPGVEMGVIALFNQVYALRPQLFPFHVVDYDSKRGYDTLVAHRIATNLAKDSLAFLEFKYVLGGQFNHAFDHLAAVVCWDSKLANGDQIRDIQDKPRTMTIAQDSEGRTHYVLSSPLEPHNIEVYVLKQFLRERLNLEFSLPKSPPS